MSELWPYQVLKMKISKFPKIWLGRKNCDNSVNFWDIAEIFFSYGHWWSPLKVPLIILHKICLIGPSEAVKEVRVKLTPPRAVEGKIPPVRDRVKGHIIPISQDISFEKNSLFKVCLFWPSFCCLIHFILRTYYSNQSRYLLWNKLFFSEFVYFDQANVAWFTLF